MKTTLADHLAERDVSFGTSGLRGTVEDLTPDVVGLAGRAFIAHLRDGVGVPVERLHLAHDLRPSSPEIAGWIAAAVASEGVEVLSFGAIPTPALALHSIAEGDPAIMVTGSHIPFDRNGLKFYGPRGEITKADEAGIANAPADADVPTAIELVPSNAARDRYVNRYIEAFAGLLDGRRVGLYEHSAVGRDINRQIFERLGAEVVSLGRSDVFVPIDTEAVSAEDRARARQWSREHGLDFVFSTDGDGDRPLMSDETGDYFDGDLLGLLAARFLGVATVVTPITSNSRAEPVGWFPEVRLTKVGSPFVLEAMETASRAPVAGFEANGGFLLQSAVSAAPPFLPGGLDALPTRDAILPALATFALARQLERPLSGLRELVGRRFKASDRLQDVARPASSALIEGLQTDRGLRDAFFAPLGTVADVNTIDGVRATLQDGRIVHLRPSGNAPEMRVYVETDAAEGSQELLQRTLAVLRDELQAPPTA